MSSTIAVEYHGPVIYRDGAVDMVLFPGGYVTVSGGVTFHYYTQDYLGNNRAVVNGSTGAIEQLIAYYPYGGVIADLGTPTTGQPYKFGGKELMTANGLNEYDFGARQYYTAIPGFTRIDPMAEKYPWLSPYLYCANNPVNAFDPDGRELKFTGGTKEDYNYICKLFNNITKNQYIFTPEIDTETNTAKITYTENSDFKDNLSDNHKNLNKEFVKTIDDTNVVEIKVDNNSSVLIGDVQKSAIDLADIRNIGKRVAVTSESALLHEVYEQYMLQSKYKKYSKTTINNSHNAACQMENRLLNKSISYEREIIYDSETMEGNGVIRIPYNDSYGKIEYPKMIKLKYKNGLILK